MHASCEIGRFAQRKLLTLGSPTNFTNNHRTGVNADADLERRPLTLSLSHKGRGHLFLKGRYNLYPRTYGAASVVFMCGRISKVDEQPIPQVLGDLSAYRSMTAVQVA